MYCISTKKWHFPFPASHATIRDALTASQTQIDAIEQYLNDYIQDLNRVSVAVGSLEESLAVHFSRPLPSHLGEEVLGDYAHAALDQHQKTNQEFWSIAISQARRVHGLLVEPFTDLRSGALRDYRETFRALESAQYKYDLLLQRYSAQSRAKDAALLRDDAFSLHEARKVSRAYTYHFNLSIILIFLIFFF